MPFRLLIDVNVSVAIAVRIISMRVTLFFIAGRCYLNFSSVHYVRICWLMLECLSCIRMSPITAEWFSITGEITYLKQLLKLCLKITVLFQFKCLLFVVI